jgi:hypothetical protein
MARAYLVAITVMCAFCKPSHDHRRIISDSVRAAHVLQVVQLCSSRADTQPLALQMRVVMPLNLLIEEAELVVELPSRI